MGAISVRQIREQDDSSVGFNIRDIKELISGKDMAQGLHRHNFFLVLLLEKGSGEHIIDFTAYPVSGSSVFFIRPGQVHRLVLKKWRNTCN